MRAELYELKSDIVWSRFSLTVVGAIVVVTGTLLPYTQLVYSHRNFPIVVQSQSDWLGYPLLSLTHDPGFVIAIVAFLTIALEVRAQWWLMASRRAFVEWNPGALGLEFVAVIVMASLVLFSWPFRGAGFVINNKGVVLYGKAISSSRSIVDQVVVLRGPGAMVSFAGIALLLLGIAMQVSTLWRFGPPIQVSDGVQPPVKVGEAQNT